MDILELYHNDTSRLHPLLAVVSDIYENIILCWKIVRELKIGGLTVKRRWLHQLCFSIFCDDYIFPLLLLLPLLPDCLRRAVAKTPFVPFQLATTQLVGEAEGYFVLHLAVQAYTIFTLLVGILCATTSSLALAPNKSGLLMFPRSDE